MVSRLILYLFVLLSVVSAIEPSDEKCVDIGNYFLHNMVAHTPKMMKYHRDVIQSMIEPYKNSTNAWSALSENVDLYVDEHRKVMDKAGKSFKKTVFPLFVKIIITMQFIPCMKEVIELDKLNEEIIRLTKKQSDEL